jgi:hypothetical protein
MLFAVFYFTVQLTKLQYLLFKKGLKNVFDEAILAALDPPQQERKRKCTIL